MASRRAWNDFVMSSHLAFLPGIAVASARGLYDAAVLISVMVFFSLWYHREAEKNRLVARVELCSVCALFAYGSLQCREAPDALALSAEVVCACVTVATYVAGFFMCDDRRCYDFWHPIGLHLVPALWSLLVAGTHPSLVPLR